MPYADPEVLREYHRQRDRQRRVENTALYRQYVEDHGPCMYCGSTHRLTLHHREGTVKRFEPSHIRGHSADTVAAEWEKCDVVCKSCHMKIHLHHDPPTGRLPK